MYPFVRMLKAVVQARRMEALGVLDTHVSTHVCWPWDLDAFAELNNGRALTLYDLGRIPLSVRTGLERVLRANRWGIAVAGSSLRYRRRVRLFDRIEMRSRCIGWDDRFFYMEQGMWRGEECVSHMLIRSAVTSRDGIVAPGRVLDGMQLALASPELPDWVAAWIAADARRPWPPLL